MYTLAASDSPVQLIRPCALSRALLLFSTMVSGFDNVHIRANVPRLEEAIKYGQSAGDRWGQHSSQSLPGADECIVRIYTSFATAHLIVTRLYIGDHRKRFQSSLLTRY